MSLADEVSALSARMAQPSIADRTRQKLSAYRSLTKAYRTCFLDADGNLTEHGKEVLKNLSAKARIGRAVRGRTAEEIQFDEGARSIVLHLMTAMHLDHDHLERMARKVRENRGHE